MHPIHLTISDRITLVELAPAVGGTSGVTDTDDAIEGCVARNGGSAAAGFPADNGGGPGVHRWALGNVQDFAGGVLGPNLCMLRDATTSAWMVRGAIRDTYFAAGGADGWLGYPAEDEHPSSRGPLQKFEHGYITEDGAHFAAFSGEP